MFEVLELFRIRFAGRPLLLSLLLTAGLLILTRRRAPLAATSVRAVVRAMAAIGFAALIFYAGIAIYYARNPHYYDYAEPTMTAVAWIYEQGQPIHHAIDSASRYAHMYGPMAFIPHGIALRVFGPSIAASKWLGVGAALFSLAFLYLSLRAQVDARRAAAFTGWCALLYLTFRNLTFWTRPDPLQILCMSVGLFAASRLGATAPVFLGVTAGVLLNLKITGPLYSLPIFTLLYARRGLRSVILAAAIGLAVAVLPFVALPNVSLESYLLWVRLSARNGLLLSTLRQNIEWALYFLLPVLLAYYANRSGTNPQSRESRWMLGGLLAGVCGTVLAASKPGATVYHLVPFLPPIFYLTASDVRSLDPTTIRDRAIVPAAAAFVVTALVLAIAQQGTFLNAFRLRSGLDEPADIVRFLDAHPGAVVEMGYGRDDRPTLVRPIVVFRSGTYLLDAPAVQEHQLSGIEIPPATIAALRACAVDYWLIPQGEEPFTGPNKYPAILLKPLFPESFRQAFFESYERDGRTQYYDVWQCRPGIKPRR